MKRRSFLAYALCLAGPASAQRKPGDEQPRPYRDEEVGPKVRSIIADQLDIEEDRVRDSASFEKDLGADSLDLVEIVLALEEEFGIEIGDAAADKLLKVGDAVECVKRYLRAAKRMS